MKFYNSFLFLICLLICSVNASSQVFRYVVATDGSGDFTTIQAAINACPDNARSYIFIKNGIYYGQTSIGSKATASTKLISLIGEDKAGVILTFDKSLPMVTTFELATTFQIYAKDFYAENITFANSAGNTGQALALYTAGDRAIFKNCILKGYQDTYRSKKGTRGYFLNCWIEGAVDFIYAGGTLFFDNCTINCVNGGGHIVAPEDSYTTKTSPVSGKTLNLGFVFRKCNLTANSDVATGSYDLGRPWNINAGAYYLNCTFGKHIKSAGWAAMSGNETTASFAEYGSLNPDGTSTNVSGRISWSFQLQQYDADSILNPKTVYATAYSTAFDPITLSTPTAQPTNLAVTGNALSWSGVAGTAGYIIYKGVNYIGSTADLTFTDQSGTSGNYSVRAMNPIGVLSDATSAITGISDVRENHISFQKKSNKILFSEMLAKIQLYNSNGIKMCESKNSTALSIANMMKGAYIIRIQTTDGSIIVKKLEI